MQDDSTPLLQRVLPHLRAVGVLVLVFTAIVGSVPMPGPSSKRMLTSKTAEEELNTWVGILSNVGIETDKDQLGDFVLEVGKWARGSKRNALYPFQPLIRLTQTQQGWGLFAYPDVRPEALVVTVRRGRTPRYDVLYDAQDPEKRWRASWLHFRRVRALYNPGTHPPRTYSDVVDWLAERVWEEDPEATQVKVWITQTHTVLPGEEREAEPDRKRHTKRRVRPKDEEDAP